MDTQDRTVIRRVTITIMLVVLVALSILPALILTNISHTDHPDPAYQTLNNYAAAQNGSVTAKTWLSQHGVPIHRTKLPSGAQVLGAVGNHGECWTLYVVPGQNSLPQLGNSSYCK